MPATEFPPDVAGLLGRLRDRRLFRAIPARRIMQNGVARLSRIDAPAG